MYILWMVSLFNEQLVTRNSATVQISISSARMISKQIEEKSRFHLHWNYLNCKVQPSLEIRVHFIRIDCEFKLNSMLYRIICFLFVSERWCPFWQKIDMFLKWSIMKRISVSKSQRKAYHLNDTGLLWDFKIPFVRNPMIRFNELVNIISRKTTSFVCQKAHYCYQWIGKHIIVITSVNDDG